MRAIKSIAALLWFPVLVIMLRYLPLDHLPNTCVFLQATGYPCATCGMTRAMMAIVDGDWYRAAAMNPMAFPIMGALIVIWAVLIDDLITGTKRYQGMLIRRGGTIAIYALAAFLIFGAIRILVLYAFYT
jgi:hypothetical protein